MSTDQIILLAVGLIVIAAVAVSVAYATAQVGGGRAGGGTSDADRPDLRQGDGAPADPSLTPGTSTASGTGAGAARTSTAFFSPGSTRQVARVVAFLFLAAVAVIVALTGAWPDSQSAIFVLLAGGMLLVVLFMDMIPPAALGRYRRPLEGIGAVVFLGLLMALSGGAGSPFLVGFFLVVAGTALSAEGRAPLAVALVAALTIAVVGLIDAIDGPLAPEALAWVGISAVSLILLADIATTAARSQRQARDEAIRASRFDALTGLYNRSFFFTTMEQEIRRSDRMGRGFTMLMLDLDDLKPVNDTFGHQWGDRLLKATADTIRRTVRFTDAAARYGGDEFVVLLPETDAAGGYVVGEKLRRDIASLTLHAADRNVRSSVSVGLVAYPDDGSTIEQLVAAADVAMYEAKRRGKNRIVGYQTRTERVATDIDADSNELVQLNPGQDVRTGGDPAPWGGARVPYRDHPLDETPLQPPGRRRYDRSSIPVEPEPDADAPWSTETAPSPEPSPRPQASPPDEPSGPPPTTRTAVDAPDGPDDDVAPWLTRTDSAEPKPRPRGESAPADPAADDAAPRRSATDQRARGTDSSRSDEIRGGNERPWIALPIEPDEPDEPPGSSQG